MCVCGTPVGHGDFEMYPAAVPYLINANNLSVNSIYPTKIK